MFNKTNQNAVVLVSFHYQKKWSLNYQLKYKYNKLLQTCQL